MKTKWENKNYFIARKTRGERTRKYTAKDIMKSCEKIMNDNTKQ